MPHRALPSDDRRLYRRSNGTPTRFRVRPVPATLAEKWMSGGTAINMVATAYNADGEVTSAGERFSSYAFGYNGQGEVTSVDNAVLRISGCELRCAHLCASIRKTGRFVESPSAR